MTAVKKFNVERALDEHSEDVKSKEQVTELPKAKGNGKGKHKSGASASWEIYTQAEWKRRTLRAYTALTTENQERLQRRFRILLLAIMLSSEPGLHIPVFAPHANQARLLHRYLVATGYFQLQSKHFVDQVACWNKSSGWKMHLICEFKSISCT